MRINRLAVAAAVALALVAPSTASAVSFLGDASGNLFTVDPTTGATSLIGNMGATMTDLALSPTGDLYGITFTSLYAINQSNAASTFIGSLGALSNANAAAFNGAGTLYIRGFGQSNLYSVHLGTGLATNLGATGVGNSSGDLAWNPSTGRLWGTSSSGGGDLLVDIDIAAPSSSTVIGPTGFGSVFGLDYSDATNLYGFTSAGQTLLLDQTTGAGTVININGVATYGATGSESAVPEPGTLGLLATGLAAARLRKSRSRRS
jgi:hypothetical protein